MKGKGLYNRDERIPLYAHLFMFRALDCLTANKGCRYIFASIFHLVGGISK